MDTPLTQTCGPYTISDDPARLDLGAMSHPKLQGLPPASSATWNDSSPRSTKTNISNTPDM